MTSTRQKMREDLVMAHIPRRENHDSEGAHSDDSTVSPTSDVLNRNREDSPISDKTFEIKVFLSSYVNVPVSIGTVGSYINLECSINSDAGRLLALTAQHIKLDNTIAESCLSLWICSPLLELQLKSRHEVIRMLEIWPKYLSRFVPHADKKAIDEDIPNICLRRNVSLSREDQERFMINDTCLQILYQDAKNCVLRGEYVMEIEHNIRLAGIGFAIDSPEHPVSVEYMKKNLDEHLPEHLASEIYVPVFIGKTLKKSRIHDVHREYEKVQQETYQFKQQEYLRLLMKECSAYGSVTFKMQIEKNERQNSFKKIRNFFTRPGSEVMVSVNPNFITILPSGKTEADKILVANVSESLSHYEKKEKSSHDRTILYIAREDSAEGLQCSSDDVQSSQKNSKDIDNDKQTKTKENVAAIMLHGAESELFHHFLKAMHVRNEQSASASPKCGVKLVSPTKNMCKAFWKDKQFVDPYGQSLGICN